MTRDEKFLRWCAAGAGLFSTCSRGQYMAIIVGPTGRVVGTGYNGGPAGYRHCSDGGCPRGNAAHNFQLDVPIVGVLRCARCGRTPARAAPRCPGPESGTDYDNCIAIHAEENALLYSDPTARRRGTIYINGAPCFGCSKKLGNSGLARVVCLTEPRLGSAVGAQMLRDVGITFDAYSPTTWRKL